MADGDDRKSALIAQLAAQRTQLSQHAESVTESLDVRSRLKASFAGNRLAWLAGAAFTGIVFSRLRPRRTVKIKGESATAKAALGAGILLPMLKVAFDLARPPLISLLTARFADFASRQQEPRRRTGPR